MTNEKLKSQKMLLSLLVAFLVGFLLFLPLEIFFEYLHPPRTLEGQVVMPIGQIIMSIVISTLISIIVFTILIYRWVLK